MELGGQSPGQSSERGAREGGSSSTNLANTDLVPSAVGPSDRLSQEAPTGRGHFTRNSGSTTPSSDSPPSRVGYLRKRFQAESLSEGATKLMLASWRSKSSKSYDGMFQKWISWCQEWDTDPISGPVSEVANFLADLYDKGYQQRSINAYRSAIASAHDLVDGVSIGQHPTISRLMSGVANARPPQPRYVSTWDVQKVLDKIEKKGEFIFKRSYSEDSYAVGPNEAFKIS